MGMAALRGRVDRARHARTPGVDPSPRRLWRYGALDRTLDGYFSQIVASLFRRFDEVVSGSDIR